MSENSAQDIDPETSTTPQPRRKTDAYRMRALVGSYRAETGDDVGASEVETPQPNWPVFGFSAIGILAMAGYAFFGRESAQATLGSVTSWIATNLGWFYILTATLSVVFVLVVAAGRSGQVKLGPDHSRPKFGLFSWASMLFAAGIGVDLMFFSVAEPLTQYMAPPTGDPETMKAAEDAVVFALFHYGITGWAMYALMGMAFGYFAYRLNMPLAIRSALYPLLGKRIHGPIGDTVDVAAMLGTVFGVAASLGIGVVQLSYGIHLIFGWEQGAGLQVALVALAIFVATLSAVSGVDKGIRRLSELNVFLAIGMMVYVVLAGKTAFLFDALIMNIGDYISSFPSWTADTYAFSPTPDETSAWMESWTLFFWAWWIAWAPFVGLFLARISRGRTLRQFIVGVLVFPFLFILMWLSFFGNSAIDLVRNGGNRAFGEAAAEVPEQGFYDLLGQYPGATFLIGIATLVGLLLYITSADSGALVMSNFTSKITDSRQDGPRWMRIFWSVTVGVLTITLLQIDGIPTVQSATVVMGLPFAVVMYLIMASLWKSLRLERYQEEARAMALPSAMSGRIDSTSDSDEMWIRRLDRANAWPTKADMARYIDEVATPALEKVAVEMRKRGKEATLLTSVIPELDLNHLDLTVQVPNEKAFRYQLFPVSEQLPEFADVEAHETCEDAYYRLEVYNLNGSLGYDIYGYTENQLINNLLDLFERHQEFLFMHRDETGSSDLSDGASPIRTWREDTEA